MAKRKKRAAISRSSRKKAPASERPHHRNTADDGEASRCFKTANDWKTADKRESSSRCEAPTASY